MNILSLFDGMSCGRIALERANIKVDNYFASEIDKYAIQVMQYNCPDTIQLGDINNWQEWNLPEIDLIIAGSPCQGFSQAGKGLNFDDPRSKLYFIFEEILKHYNPKYWLLENVVMKQEWQDVISQRLGISPIMINSALVSAQNRERLYWTNIGSKPDLFGNPFCTIEQPKDKKIYLKDIIEDGIVDRNKSLSLVANYHKTSRSDSALDRYTRKQMGQLVFDYPKQIGRINNSQDGKVIDVKDKSYALTSGHNNWPKIWWTDNYLQFDRSDKGYKSQQDRLYYLDSKAPTIPSSNPVNKMNILLNKESLTWRKLTPLECERLQTVPDNYTLVLDENGKQLVSNTQRYKMLGNGWTVDVIAHILKHIL